MAGTEDGIKEPQATFSACFGAAFIMLHPTKYAAMLAEKMQKYGATGWLVNTGWSGGRYIILLLRDTHLIYSFSYWSFFLYYSFFGMKLWNWFGFTAGTVIHCIFKQLWVFHVHYFSLLFRYGVGKRIKLPYTRKIIDAIHSGELLNANYKKTEVFGLEIPTALDGVPSEILDPINTVSICTRHFLCQFS